MNKILITGISGQDGSYLSELMLDKGHKVYGLIRRHSNYEYNTKWLDESQVQLLYGDMTDTASLIKILETVEPDVIYNLAGQSDVRLSFDNPVYTATVNALGPANLFETVKIVNKKIKIYQASSSEIFGNQIDEDGFQRESTRMIPVSPYGSAKLFAYNIANNYRQNHEMHIVNGILFNHESYRRGTGFVTNKIVKEAVKIKYGFSEKINIGNINASRDWGHAKDYVNAMYLMMQQPSPSDYVCATGTSNTIKYLLEYVFRQLDLNYQNFLYIDPIYFRKTDISFLKGDSTKLKTSTGWKPTYSLEKMLDEMIDYWLINIGKK